MIIEKNLIELLTPKQSSQDEEAEFQKFQDRYNLFLQNDLLISITDNPMGNLSYTGPEMIDNFNLETKPENLMVHLNTFHRKTNEKFNPDLSQNEQDLDIIIQHAIKLGMKKLFCVSGDGSPRLPRLCAKDLDCDPNSVKTVTSIQLIEYIKKIYPGQFTIGVAFNQYEPWDSEEEKLHKKIAAGASFIITQPFVLDSSSDERIGIANKNINKMLKVAQDEKIQVVLGVWMSKKLSHLMGECVGCDINFGNYEPQINLRSVHETYPDNKLYLSMIFNAEMLKKAKEML